MALPFLEAMTRPSKAAAAAGGTMRMVCVGLNFGMQPSGFFPTTAGRDYEMPHLLKPMEPHRRDFTIFSHLDHGVEAQGGHNGVHAYLSGVLSRNAKGMPEGNISLDQKAAEWVGTATRFPSLQVSVGGDPASQISWTRNGVAVPPIRKLQTLFDQLFRDTDGETRRRNAQAQELNASILDLVRDDAKSLERRLGKADREKLDEYFTSVRGVERKLAQSREWLQQPRPVTDFKLPAPAPSVFVEEMPYYYDLVRLALQTDSTRIVTLVIAGWNGDPGLAGVNQGYHTLTHHGHDPARLRELAVIETFHSAQFARFLTSLKEVRVDEGATLFDRTMSLFGSGMGNASSHSNKDLPLLLAGGGFRHGEHRDFPKTDGRHTPACNLFVSMLQRFGLEVDKFGTGTGTLTGLA